MMRGNKQKLTEIIKGKKVAYIATKNSDYIRITQEVRLVKEHAKDCLIIVSEKKHYIARVIDVYLKLLRTNFNEYDIVFIGFMSQMILPWFRFKFKNSIIIEDFFISVFDTLVDDRKKIKRNTFIGKLLYLLDKKALNSAQIIISDTVSHGQYFREEFGITGKEFLTLYLEADNSLYYPRTIKKPDRWKDKFLVLYFGSILPVQGVEVVLEAIRLLKGDPEIHFLIIGPIAKEYEKPETRNVSYIEWLDQAELAEYIAFSDLCLAGHFSKTVEKANRTIPGKAYIYEAMNKPMVLGDSQANHEISQKNVVLPLVERGNPLALVNIILSCKDAYEN